MPVDRSRAGRQRTLRARVWRSPRARVGLLLVASVVLLALGGVVATPFDPLRQNLATGARPPLSIGADGGFHLLGTDTLGRDLLSRILFGARISLLVGALAVFVAGGIGVTAGVIAGYFGRWIDQFIMRLADVQLAIPVVLLAIALVAALGPGLVNLIVVLGVARWPVYARTVRGSVLAVRELQYVEAARSLGAAHLRILWRHVLPNVLSPILVIATQQVGIMILTESSLTFLGIGVPPEVPTWGAMIADGRNYLTNAWWVTTVPGLALMLTVMAVYFFGDGLRDVLDPRLRI